MEFSCCDLCDANEDKLADGSLQALPPGYQAFGQHIKFAGPAKTLKVFEDNVLVRSTLETPGQGRVLMIDAGGSLRCALVGGNLGALAEKNGWAGIVIDGCVRDTDELAACAIGVRALGTHPRRSFRKGVGEEDGAVTLSGVKVFPGDWVYVDVDGILVSRQALHA